MDVSHTRRHSLYILNLSFFLTVAFSMSFDYRSVTISPAVSAAVSHNGGVATPDSNSNSNSRDTQNVSGGHN